MESLRGLPSVDELWRRLAPVDGLPPEVIKDEIRAVLAERRAELRNGSRAVERPLEEEITERLAKLLSPSLRPLINATGIVLHTNLGRAPLARFIPIEGYSNLEYDVHAGQRGRRDAHVSPLLEHLLGTPAIVVNNNAAAVYLVLHELAAAGEVIVSRGELIEIGDGFRIPEIMERAGVGLREVGTTNRTRIEDYRRAVTEKTRLILRVHPSNFHISGFTARPSLKQMASLARERGLTIFEDLGSGCLMDLREYGISEPLVGESLRAGINLVTFSGDKLLGGPQAGIIAGDRELIERIRRNPMYRAFRVDKLILQALETTLRHALKRDWQQIPAMRMIRAPVEELRARAARLASQLSDFEIEVRDAQSPVGGGSTPDQSLPTVVLEIAVDDAITFEKQLRAASTPVIARIERNRIILDMRTIANEEEKPLIDSLRCACI